MTSFQLVLDWRLVRGEPLLAALVRRPRPIDLTENSFIILVTAATVVVLYPLLALRLRRQSASGGGVPDAVAYKMLAYPPAYLLLVLPIAIYRAMSRSMIELT